MSRQVHVKTSTLKKELEETTGCNHDLRIGMFKQGVWIYEGPAGVLFTRHRVVITRILKVTLLSLATLGT